ncbi:hypothetical protein VCHC47A1_0208 [Vibrio cholerae HC-47A1]|nr:hypothetical protein VCHC47A1_0208 [Vibrio cholerae HC-47A1]
MPLNYFFCEDDESAELACLIHRMSPEEKKNLLKDLISKK